MGDKKIENIVKERLEGFESDAPSGSWDAIEAAMGESPVTPFYKKAWVIVPALIVVLSGLVSIPYIMNSGGEEEIAHQENNIEDTDQSTDGNSKSGMPVTGTHKIADKAIQQIQADDRSVSEIEASKDIPPSANSESNAENEVAKIQETERVLNHNDVTNRTNDDEGITGVTSTKKTGDLLAIEDSSNQPANSITGDNVDENKKEGKTSSPIAIKSEDSNGESGKKNSKHIEKIKEGNASDLETISGGNSVVAENKKSATEKQITDLIDRSSTLDESIQEEKMLDSSISDDKRSNSGVLQTSANWTSQAASGALTDKEEHHAQSIEQGQTSNAVTEEAIGNDSFENIKESLKTADNSPNKLIPFSYQPTASNLKSPQLRFYETDYPILSSSVEERTDKEDQKTGGFGPWAAYFYGMPTFSYHRIESNQSDDILITSVEKVSPFSLDRLGFRLETGIQRSINDKFNISVGVLYWHSNQQFRYNVSQVDSIIAEPVAQNNSLILSPQFEDQQRTYNYSLRNIGLHFGTSFNLSSKRLVQQLGGGIEIHKALNKPGVSDFTTEEPDYYLFYNLFYRMEYPRDKPLRLLFQPTFNYSLSLDKNFEAPFYVKPYGFGLNFGFVYRFR